MGCVQSLSEEDRAKKLRSQQIDRGNKTDYDKSLERINLLLLGAGESGKSTVMKQMRFLYGSAYTQEELVSFRLIMHRNIIETMEILCESVKKFYPDDKISSSAEYALVSHPEDSKGLSQYRQLPVLSEDYVKAISFLWNSDAFQKAWSRRSELQIVESVEKFMDHLEAIAEPTFRPNVQDVLLCRSRSSGIREEKLVIDGHPFHFFDVGGQRNERRKWIHCFDDVQGMIFVISLSEFNQTLWEDNNVNRMVEALHLFDATIADKSFQRSAIILFLNKSDLFREKIKTQNIRDVVEFSDFSGPDNDYQAGLDYFRSKFLAYGAERGVKVYSHVTCATDTETVRVVFNACKEVIVKRALSDGGFNL
jgi:GTPase SAR1 family protein